MILKFLLSFDIFYDLLNVNNITKVLKGCLHTFISSILPSVLLGILSILLCLGRPILKNTGITDGLKVCAPENTEGQSVVSGAILIDLDGFCRTGKLG